MRECCRHAKSWHESLWISLTFLCADGYDPVAEGNLAELSEARSEPGQAEASGGTQVGSICIPGSMCQACISFPGSGSSTSLNCTLKRSSTDDLLGSDAEATWEHQPASCVPSTSPATPCGRLQGQAAVSTAASGPESAADGDPAAEVSQPRRGRGRPFQRRPPTWVDWHGPIAAHDLPQVRQQWVTLRERAAALRPVERYRVVTVAYTR